MRRYFMKQYGFLVSGLEAGSALSGWVPNSILATLEQSAGKQGVDLRGLATLAASLEDLLAKTSQERLVSAHNYTVDGRELLDHQLSHDEAANVLETYLMMSLSPASWNSTDANDLIAKKQFFRFHQKDRFKMITDVLYRPLQE